MCLYHLTRTSSGTDMGHKTRTRCNPKRLSQASLYSWFHLTPAEGQIALKIASGKTLAEIAEARGTSISTARSQLKRIFAKTGTHRQAELVVLLAGSSNARVRDFRRRRP